MRSPTVSRAARCVLSPDHAVFADGVLVPVKHLSTAAASARSAVDAVTYFHVELARARRAVRRRAWRSRAISTPATATRSPTAAARCSSIPIFPRCHGRRPARNWCRRGIAWSRCASAFSPRRRRSRPARRWSLAEQRACGRTPGARMWRFDVADGGRSLRLLSPAWMPAAHHPARSTAGCSACGCSASAFDGRCGAPGAGMLVQRIPSGGALRRGALPVDHRRCPAGAADRHQGSEVAPRRRNRGAKVFWFFFSKKNRFL